MLQSAPASASSPGCSARRRRPGRCCCTILPNDPGFGSPVLGLHLYTWCLIAFAAHIGANALMLVGTAWLPQQQQRMSPWPATGATAAALALIVVANLLSVIAEAGFNWDLPSDPKGYLLFK